MKLTKPALQIVARGLCSLSACCAGSSGGGLGLALAFIILAKIIAAAPHQDSGPPPAPTPVRIGDDFCAVWIEVRAKVIDANEIPVEAATVSFRHTQVEGAEISSGHALRGRTHLDVVGITNRKGLLVKRLCYQGSGEYYISPPKGEVALTFVVSARRYKDHEVRRVVAASALLREGLLFSSVRPRLVPRPGLKPDAAFQVKVEVVLRDVA